MKKVLLTGSDGYIGAVLRQMLIAEGFEVSELDVGYFSDCTFAGGHLPNKLRIKDARDVVGRDLAGVDAVIHLAALSNDPMSELEDRWTEQINFRASVRLAQIARDNGAKRFLLSSSCSIYGASGAGDYVTEESRLAPLTAYAVSKVRTEEAISSMADREFSPVYLRNATAYGVSPKLRTDLVVNNLVGWAYLTGNVKLMSDGTQWRPLVHVEDIARAFIGALRVPRDVVHNQAFNVGSTHENYRIRDIAAIVESIVPGARIEFAPDARADKRDYRVDFTKFGRVLKEYAPVWDARKGARQLYEAYSSAGLTEKDFREKYVRLAHLKRLITQELLDSELRWRT